jgi:hypothetical protein
MGPGWASLLNRLDRMLVAAGIAQYTTYTDNKGRLCVVTARDKDPKIQDIVAYFCYIADRTCDQCGAFGSFYVATDQKTYIRCTKHKA